MLNSGIKNDKRIILDSNLRSASISKVMLSKKDMNKMLVENYDEDQS